MRTDLLSRILGRATAATTLLLGLLLGIACDGDSPAVADPLVDVVAAAVGYDPAVSGLKAVTVQAAIDELDGRLDAVESAGEGAASERAAQSSRLDALEAGSGGGDALAAVVSDVSALTGRVDALEVAPAPSADAVAVAAIEGLDGADVQAALQAVQARLGALETDKAALQTTVDGLVAGRAALQATVDGLVADKTALQATVADLQAQLAGPPECPAGMVRVNETCIEKAPHTIGNGPDTDVWKGAAYMCNYVGQRLCRFDELQNACIHYLGPAGIFPFDGTPEWTSDWLDATTALAVGFSTTYCDATDAVAIQTEGYPTNYRCCITLP